MFHRQGYAIPLRCVRCGTIGNATFKKKDEDSPPDRVDQTRELLRIEGKFRPGIGRDPNIYCIVCGKPVI